MQSVAFAVPLLPGQYADVYHLRDGKITAHWHLAVDPKADAEAASVLFAS